MPRPPSDNTAHVTLKIPPHFVSFAERIAVVLSSRHGGRFRYTRTEVMRQALEKGLVLVGRTEEILPEEHYRKEDEIEARARQKRQDMADRDRALAIAEALRQKERAEEKQREARATRAAEAKRRTS